MEDEKASETANHTSLGHRSLRGDAKPGESANRMSLGLKRSLSYGQPIPNRQLEAPELERALSVASSVPTASTFPDGGLRAWSVLFGCSMMSLLTFGFLNGYGTFQGYYQLHQLSDRTPSEISWIGSVQLFLMFSGGLLFGRLFDLYGPRWLLFTGSCLIVLSDITVSFCTQYYQFFLAQALLFGTGNSMLFFAGIGSLQHWFWKRRGLALGIFVGGSSIGGCIWPVALTHLFESIGFGWGMRVIAFINIPFLIAINFLIKSRLPPRDPGPFIDFKFFRDMRFTYLSFGYLLILGGSFYPFFYLPILGQNVGLDPTNAPLLLTLLNGVSFFGRLLPGFMSDRLGPFNMCIPCVLMCGILIFASLSITTPTGLFVFAGCYGFFSGSFISLNGTMIASICGNLKEIGSMIGVSAATSSIAALVGSPIAGAIITAQGGQYWGATVFAGICILTGALLIIISRLYCGPLKKKL